MNKRRTNNASRNVSADRGAEPGCSERINVEIFDRAGRKAER